MGELNSELIKRVPRQVPEDVSGKLASSRDRQSVAAIGLTEIYHSLNRYGAVILFDGLHPESISVNSTPNDWSNYLASPQSLLNEFASFTINIHKTVPITTSTLGKVTLIPLSHHFHVLGMMIIQGEVEDQDDVDYMVQIGKEMGDCYHHLHNLVKPHIINEILSEAFVKIIGSISETTPLSESQLEAVRAIQTAFSCDAVSLILPDQDGIFIKKTIFPHETSWRYQVAKKITNSILSGVMQDYDLVLINDPLQHSDYNEEIDGIVDIKIHSMMYLPLVYLGKLQGILQLVRLAKDNFTPEDKSLLLSSAGFISSIFYNSSQSYHLQVVNAELEASGWELTRSRNTLRALFDHMPYSVYIVDQDYRLNAVNMARCRRVNEDPRVLNGKICYRVLFGFSEPCPDCLVSETLMTGKATHRKKVIGQESEDQIEWEIDTYPIFNEEGQVVQAILFEQDVTESRRLEMIIAQSEKLAAIGQLAAGVAHEINNPLTVILANTQLLLKEITENQDWREALDLIEKASIRAQQVVRNMLGLARKEEYDFIPVNVNDNIQRSLQLIKHELLVRAVELDFIPALDMPDIMASEDHLQGVWMNIILNGIDATENTQNASVEIRTMYDDSSVRVLIHDNGHGIPPDKIKRIFEPFYTTRGPGRQTGGTGLGLSVCYRIIRQHGGEIFVESKVGVGTTFTVVLPLVVKTIHND